MLKRTGTLCYGNLLTGCQDLSSADEKLFQWFTEVLPLAPISCTRLDNFLVMTDGHSSIMCDYQRDTSKILNLNIFQLPIKGSVKVYVNQLKIVFIICDGRKYEKTIIELQILADDATMHDEDDIDTVGLSLTEVLKTSERMNEDIRKETKNLEYTDHYLEQLNLVYYFLSRKNELQTFFNVKLSAYPSIEKEDSFVLNIKMSQNRSCKHNLQGKWWQLMVNLNNNFCQVYNDLTVLFSNEEYIINVRFPDSLVTEMLEFSKTDADILVDFSLIFLDFSTCKPLCSVFVYREYLYLFNFLTVQKSFNSIGFHMIDTSFKEMISSCNSDSNNRPENCTIKLHMNEMVYKETLTLFEKDFKLVSFLFPKFENFESLASDNSINAKWYFKEIAVNFALIKTNANHTIEITIESTFQALINALRRDIQSIVLKSSHSATSVKLNTDIFRKTRMLKVSSALETDSSPFVLQTMAKNVKGLLGSIPF